MKSFSKEIVCLVTTTETIFFVNKTEIPEECRGNVTYGQIVCTYRDAKKVKFLTRITMGGNLINYPGDCRTPTAYLLTVKLLLNSVISTPNARFMTLDLKDFYLMTPMKCYEYFQMKLELFPQDIIDLYDLQKKADHNGNVHCEVPRGMYGLPQAGLVGNSNFWFQFLGPPSKVEFQFHFQFQRFWSFFLRILLLKSQEIGILIPKFGIPKKMDVGIQYTSFHIRYQS
jgi:hypothetical protein